MSERQQEQVGEDINWPLVALWLLAVLGLGLGVFWLLGDPWEWQLEALAVPVTGLGSVALCGALVVHAVAYAMGRRPR